MAMDFGVSFSPTEKNQQQQPDQMGGGQTPIQDAIRTLSLRIPQFRSQGLAPLPLLMAPGSRGVMPGMTPMRAPGMGGQMPAGLQQIMASMFGGQQTPTPSTPSAPPPHITPGQTPPSGWNRQPAPYTGGPTPDPGYDLPQDPGHFMPGNWG